MTAPSTYRNDLGSKHDLYESWGVQEYWQYDPHTRFLTPLLQGSQLVDGRYQPIPVDIDADSGRCVAYSAAVNLELRAGREWFRFADPLTGRIIANRQEVEQDLAQERAARQALEALLREHGIEPPASD